MPITKGPAIADTIFLAIFMKGESDIKNLPIKKVTRIETEAYRAVFRYLLSNLFNKFLIRIYPFAKHMVKSICIIAQVQAVLNL